MSSGATHALGATNLKAPLGASAYRMPRNSVPLLLLHASCPISAPLVVCTLRGLWFHEPCVENAGKAKLPANERGRIMSRDMLHHTRVEVGMIASLMGVAVDFAAHHHMVSHLPV